MIALLSIILVLMGLSISAVKRVPAGQVVSVYRHGKPRRLLQEGTHMLVPGLDRVGHRINLGGQVLEFREPLPNAHDVRGTVYWQGLGWSRSAPMR